ncbi:hypothetical protein JOM56_014109 [Amanita muscaria]
MPSLTATQVISRGQYLEPDFDPASLTIPQLLGIFVYHGIRYPMPYSKQKLVQHFNAELKPRSGKYIRERMRNEKSIPSPDGIKDGLTGEFLAVKQCHEIAGVTDRYRVIPNSKSGNRNLIQAGPTVSVTPSTEIAVHPATIDEDKAEVLPGTSFIRTKSESYTRRLRSSLNPTSGFIPKAGRSKTKLD